MLVGTLLASPVWAQPPSDPDKTESAPKADKTPVLDAETSRALRQFIARREQAEQSSDTDAKPDADRTTSTPPAISGELEAVPIQRARKPYTIGCDKFDCYSFDRSGHVLEKIPREKVIGKFGNDPDNTLTCQSENNMLSTFERDAYCRGLADGLVNPYRPVETASDQDRSRDP